ncbi:SagB/ThcOx family dehydrogenase [Peptococcaceae bacterium]|nr:SagB/ThcOx family dehydrogenase [Peptococcaceae bacterium]
MNFMNKRFTRRDFINVFMGASVSFFCFSLFGCENKKVLSDDNEVTGNYDVKGDNMGGFINAAKANIVDLPAPSEDGAMSVERAISNRRSRRRYSDSPITIEQLSQLLWSAQGITDKIRNFFRAAPSAGALYPLDVYVVAGNVSGLQPGVYCYLHKEHSLKLHKSGDVRTELAHACLNQMFIAPAPALIVITVEYKRITRRYGERGIRYAHMEVGHIGQNLHLQAESLGLGTVVIGAFKDDEVSKVMSLPRQHEPMYVMPFGYTV